MFIINHFNDGTYLVNCGVGVQSRGSIWVNHFCLPLVLSHCTYPLKRLPHLTSLENT